jgi:hypothetical protein
LCLKTQAMLLCKHSFKGGASEAGVAEVYSCSYFEDLKELRVFVDGYILQARCLYEYPAV